VADNPDICVICNFPLVGTRIGAGDGSGQKFAHPSCYWQREAKRLEERCAVLADKFDRAEYLCATLHRNTDRATLRDTFAAAALTGLLTGKGPLLAYDQIVRAAYVLADAMLARRAVVKP
jgi:hypothetical protein